MTPNPASIPRCVRKATIRLDLVAVPVKLYTSTESSEAIKFNMLHDEDGSRLKQQYVCTKCGKVVDEEHTVRGYEHAKGCYVTFTEAELATLKAVASDDITISEFVENGAVDPLYVEKTYYVGPDKGSEYGFALLGDVMAKTDKFAIGTYARQGSEVVFMLRPLGGILAIHELRWAHEVKRSDGIACTTQTIRAQELKLAKQIVERMSSNWGFIPERYTDKVQERVKAMIAAKVEGGQIAAEPQKPAQVIDLIAALKATLEKAPAKKKATKRNRAARVASVAKKRRAAA